jgi:hypothetical protein
MKFFRFILSHSIFIAFCAVSLCFQTAIFFKNNLPINFYWFIFFSTISTYNLYWLLSISFTSKLPIVQLVKKKPTNSIAFIVSSLLVIFFIFPFYRLYLPLLISLGLTFFYIKPLLQFGNFKVVNNGNYLKTILLAFTWAFVTVIFPAMLVEAVVTAKLILVFVDRFLFMLLLCIIFDKRDALIDQLKELKYQNINLKNSTIDRLFHFVLLLFIINSFVFKIIFQNNYFVLGTLIIALVVGFVYFLSNKNRGYYFYYFLVDGLMIFSAFVMYMAMN